MIEVEFKGEMCDARRRIFLDAAERWDAIIQTSFDPISVDGQTLSGLHIDASIEDIDGEQGVLGQAGPTILRPGSELPVKGIMQFDTADVMRLERDNSFEDVVLHEMAHVLGFGTLWQRAGLLQGTGTINPQFTGTAANREFAELVGGTEPGLVPVANTGGAGTREGHWRELVFGNELLTGFLSGANRPISRMSVASFEDLGYLVNYSAADAFMLPSFRQLAEQGVTEAVRICDLCRMGRPEPQVLEL